MKRLFAYVFLSHALCLCGCKEKELNSCDGALDSNEKLFVDENPFQSEQKWSMQIPKDWNVRKFDTGMDFLTYSFDGPSGHMFLYVGMDPHYQPQMVREPDKDVFTVGKSHNYISDDFGDTTHYSIHLKEIRFTPTSAFRKDKKESFYLEFTYNHYKSDSTECERMINSLALADSVPEGAYKAVVPNFWRKYKNFSLHEILCDGCMLQDSVGSQNDSVLYFECEYDSVAYRFVSDSFTEGDTLSVLEKTNEFDGSLKKCRSPFYAYDGFEVGMAADAFDERFMNEKKHSWFFDRADTLDLWDKSLDSLTVCFRRTEVFFKNDTAYKVIVSQRNEKVKRRPQKK